MRTTSLAASRSSRLAAEGVSVFKPFRSGDDIKYILSCKHRPLLSTILIVVLDTVMLYRDCCWCPSARLLETACCRSFITLGCNASRVVEHL
jgi:hypothetical protein